MEAERSESLTHDGTGREPAASREAFKPGEYGPSIIGTTVVMRGELTLAEDLTIEGTFDGSRIDGAKNLAIGARARVRAHIQGESADIAGTVDGDFAGTGTVVLRRTARIHGAISAERLRVEDGTNLENAVLCGRISLTDE
ncbi:MAG TPA: polymer-forming cytoskeletal protein [Woeseiaceae bacterium]|nr:polymer-forming cytoskeletal protein [Woeseiaceae bacterium]